MANADQILILIRSHIDKDENLFLKIALQISAVEAKAGHATYTQYIQSTLTPAIWQTSTTRKISTSKSPMQ